MTSYSQAMIYTKTGDQGATSLANGQRVDKDSLRVEANGTVDELNSHIGLLRTMLPCEYDEYGALLRTVQDNLFVIQTLLAFPEQESRQDLPQVSDHDILAIEDAIDQMEAVLPALNGFVIVGGSMAAAQSHVARCVCRRAERQIVALSKAEKIESHIMVYINRLSDLLFVLARRINQLNGVKEDLYTTR